MAHIILVGLGPRYPMPDGENRADYVGIRQLSNIFNMQNQYMSRYLESWSDNYLAPDLRVIVGSGGNYHMDAIHKDDVQTFFDRLIQKGLRPFVEGGLQGDDRPLDLALEFRQASDEEIRLSF